MHGAIRTDSHADWFDHGAMRVDLHLHSIASGAATNWWVKGLGLGFETRESYTPPSDAYDMVKAAGMNFATLTDHETIDGAATLLDRPGFFPGEEVCALFPESGSAADVLVYGVTAAHHPELQARRGDIYALVAYLREANLLHVLAHPVFEMETPLDREGIEKRIALFSHWELINGARPEQQNRLACEIAASVEASDIRALARKHGLPIPSHTRIVGTAGSDDHAGVSGGGTYTIVPRVTGVADMLEAIRRGETTPSGRHGAVAKMVNTGLRIAGMAVMAGESAPTAETDGPRAGQVEKLVGSLPFLATLDDKQTRVLLSTQYERRVTDALDGGAGGFPMLRLLSSIGSFVEGHLFIAPYLAMHGYFGRELQKTRALRRSIFPDRAEPVRAAVFVDLFDEVHGVGTLYRNLQRVAATPSADRLTVIRCGQGEPDDAVTIRPIATMTLPLYDGRSLGVPSLLDVLDHVAEGGYDVLHIATPGPLGVAALIAGRMLGLPIIGGYHTEFGAYAQALSGDTIVGDIVEVAVREFFERCTVIAVPSIATGRTLRERGYRINRLEVLKNGVDTTLYHPDRRDPALRDRLGGGRMLLLYAGRVSREKGLQSLAEGYLRLRDRRDDVQLVIAGDGPYRKELEQLLGDRAVFTGFLHGEALADVYASCDLFLFPSLTDTLGRAVAEAQASGVPAIVFGSGGTRECINPDESGIVIPPGDNPGFWRAVESLLDDPARRRHMGDAARAFAQTLTWDSVLEGLIALYREVVGLFGVAAPADGEQEAWLARMTRLVQLDLTREPAGAGGWATGL